MSTEQQATESTTVESGSGGDDFSPAERAYFESRGEKGLDTPAPAPQPTPTKETLVGDAQQQTQTADADSVDGELVIDESGQIRDRKTGRWVPHGAFHKERETRKAAEAEAAKMREERARLDERLSILTQAISTPPQQQQQQPKDDTPPDPKEDVFGYIDWQARQLKALQQQLEQATKQTTERIESRELADAYRADASAFAREKPDFGAAYQHLVRTIDAELQMRGISDANERMARIAQMEQQEVQTARRLGKRPAEWIYSLAATRGYTAAPAAAKAASEPASATPDAAAKLANVDRGQKAAVSLSQAGGSAPAALTVESLLSMSDAEFAAFAKSNNRTYRQLLGG